MRSLAAEFPAAGPLLARATGASIERTVDGFRIAQRPPAALGSWSSTSRGLVVELSEREPGLIRLSVPGKPGSVRVRRVGAAILQAAVSERAIVARGGDGPDSFFFATSSGIEELLLRRDGPSTVRYDFELAPGWRLRRARGHRPIVEVIDGSGVPRIRMRAERAWDTAGRTLEVEASVAGRQVELSVQDQAHGPVLIDPEWQQTGTPTDVRYGATSTLLPTGKVLVAGGGLRSGLASASADLYDPATNTFEPTGSLAHARWGHTATLLLSGKVLVAGGGSIGPHFPEEASRTVELYDPDTGDFALLGSMDYPRVFHSATRLENGDVLLVGGTPKGPPESTVPTSTAELFAAEDGQLSEVGPLNIQRLAHTATLLPDGSVLIAGGSASGLTGLGSLERYDPVARSFTDVTPSPSLEARLGHAAVLLPHAGGEGQILIAGGHPDAGSATASVTLYDLASAALVASPPPPDLPTALGVGQAAMALLPDGRVLVAGGASTASGPAVTETFLYEPGDSGPGTWSSDVGPLPSPSFPCAATLLPNGKVLVVGSEQSAQLFEPTDPARPVTNTAAGHGNMAQPRAAHTSTLLADGSVLIVGRGTAERYVPESPQGFYTISDGPLGYRWRHSATRLVDGRVLLAGGTTGDGSVASSAEVYEPDTGTFTPVGDLIDARQAHRATLLPDGRVLVTGGISQLGYLLASIELFDPESGLFEPVAATLTTPRREHAALLLPDGIVLIVGGWAVSSGEPAQGLVHPELFDPTTGQLTQFEFGLAEPRGALAATVLPDGMVLLAGGAAGGLVPELFDPITRSFTRVLFDASAPRYGATATLLPSGKVLIAGGDPLTPQHLPCVTLYDPVTQRLSPSEDHCGPRWGVAASLLQDGRVLVTGGRPLSGTTAETTAELWTLSPSADVPRQPVVTSGSSEVPVVTPGTDVLIEGQGLTGDTEASGGPRPSPTDYPIALWLPLEGPPTLGKLVQWSRTGPEDSASWLVPAVRNPGPGLLFVVASGIHSVGAPVNVERAAQGVMCPGGSACSSGHCVDGVCCNEPCADPCLACSEDNKGSGVDGECGPLPAIPDPTGRCPIEDVATCGSNGMCDGNGACARYAEGTLCAPGLGCFDDECRAGKCDGDHIVSHAGGSVEDCSPYRCSTSTHDCVDSCTSNLDCTAGYTCTPSGTCEDLLPDDVRSCAPACALGARSRSGLNGCWLGLGVLGWAARRARRRLRLRPSVMVG